jgi:hypothetical protein
MASSAFEAEQNILGATCQLVDNADLTLRQALVVHPCVEDPQIDAFEFIYPTRRHRVPFTLLGYDVTTKTSGTALRHDSTPDLPGRFSVSSARGATMRGP